MNSRTYLVLFLFGLAVSCFHLNFQPIPGYLDSDYYFAVGIQLATGKGFTEPYLWNPWMEPPRFRIRPIVIGCPSRPLSAALGMWFTGQITMPRRDYSSS